jgi:peptide/nickel transport system substrate-binding protein
MKKTIALAALFGFASSVAALAAPVITPAAVSVTKPSEVQRGGVFRDSQFGDETSFNPLYVRKSPSVPNYMGAYGSFFTLDEVTRDYVPYLAENYTLSADKRVWTFNLRKGAKWSDGKPIIADDFVLAAKINTDEKMETEYYDTYFIDDKEIKVEKVDTDTVRVTLPKATADGIEQAQVFAMPSHIFGPAYAKGKEALENLYSLSGKPSDIVTMGRWVMTGYRPGERVIFAKNPTFGEWNVDSANKPLPYLDGYSVEIVKDGNAQLASFLAGNIDAYVPRNADDLSQIKRAVDGGGLKAVLRPNISSAATGDRIAWNWNRKSDPWKEKLFRDNRFRRAMSHLMNRTAMVQIALGGTGQPMYDSIAPLFKKFQSPNMSKFDFNLEAASKILAGMGFTKKNSEGYLVDAGGKVLEFDLSPNAGNNRRAALSKVFQDEAKKVGVKVNVRPVDTGTWSDYLGGAGLSDDRKFDAVMYGIVGGGVILPYSSSLVDCRNGNLVSYNQSGKCLQPWETTAVNLYSKVQTEFDAKKRLGLIFQLQDLISKEQPVVYLVSPTYHGAWTSRTQGEYPADLAGADLSSTMLGARDLSLTWIKQ